MTLPATIRCTAFVASAGTMARSRASPGIATARALGLGADFPANWGAAWLTSWAVAFPTVLVVAPLARRLVAALTAPARP